MGGGLLQLVAKGNQDSVLTSNPQITFFKAIYKRHTNFSIESIEQQFDGSVDFGNELKCLIGRQGDLMNKIYFRVKLPAPTDIISTSNFNYKNWINNIGHALIEEASISIGGYEIDKHYSEWLDIYNELTDPMHHEWDLIGKKVDARELEMDQSNLTEYYIPLKFWFNRNIGLSLPLISLQYHEINLKIKIRDLKKILVTDSTDFTIKEDTELNEFKLYIDYIFLDEDERKRFAQNKQEYLIEQLQYQAFNDLNTGLNNFYLDFKHPIKELIWVFRHEDRGKKTDFPKLNLKSVDTNGNDWFNYNGTQINTTLGLNTYDIFGSFNIELNGVDRFEFADPLYFRKLQPYNHHTNIPQKHIYVYSFGLNPEKYQPSGTCNFSKLDTIKMVFKDIISTNHELLVYATNYNVLTIKSGQAYLKYAN